MVGQRRVHLVEHVNVEVAEMVSFLSLFVVFFFGAFCIPIDFDSCVCVSVCVCVCVCVCPRTSDQV